MCANDGEHTKHAVHLRNCITCVYLHLYESAIYFDVQTAPRVVMWNGKFQ